MRKGYKVDFIMQEIIVTKKFLKAAEEYGTREYNLLVNLTKELPNFHLREKVVHRVYRNYEMIVA